MKNVLLGALILLQTTLGQSGETKDDTASGCQNFTFSSIANAYLPSDVISLSGSCDNTQQDTKAFCPSWNITSPLVKIIFLRNQTVLEGKKCTRFIKIQAVAFNTLNQRVQLLVEFEYPKSEPIKEINLQRSDDGVFCRQSRDCYYSDQLCSSSGTCTCSDQWVFIRNVQKCVPGISRVKGQCQYPEQCLIPYSFCQYSGCECDRFYYPNFNNTRCLPEESGLGNSCLTDLNCELGNNNTVCRNNYCGCRDGYTYDYETRENGCRPKEWGYRDSCLTDQNCQLWNNNTVCRNNYCDCRDGFTYDNETREKGCLPNGAASFKVRFGWWIIVCIFLIKNYCC